MFSGKLKNLKSMLENKLVKRRNRNQKDISICINSNRHIKVIL